MKAKSVTPNKMELEIASDIFETYFLVISREIIPNTPVIFFMTLVS